MTDLIDQAVAALDLAMLWIEGDVLVSELTDEEMRSLAEAVVRAVVPDVAA